MTELSFYSKLVRLKVKSFFIDLDYCLEFLFQTGAIKSKANVMFPTMLPSFYSKLVRLKETCLLSDIPLHCCFYSKLVRLKVIVSSKITIHIPTFLFQTGAIKSMAIQYYSSRHIWFLFQTGAIKSPR